MMVQSVLTTPQFELWLLTFVVCVARLSFLIFLMPGLGEQTVPAQARLLVMIALGIAVASSGAVTFTSVPELDRLMFLIGGEILVGLFLGITLRLSIWILSIAGTIIAQSIGLSQFLGVALEQEAQTLTANLLSLAGATLLVSANYHVHAVASHVRLYSDLPVGGLAVLDPSYFVQICTSAFGFALMLAWPFVAFSLLYNICLGFINRALPQLMVAFVGAPFMVGAGTVLLAVTIGGLLAVWTGYVHQLAQWM